MTEIAQVHFAGALAFEAVVAKCVDDGLGCLADEIHVAADFAGVVGEFDGAGNLGGASPGDDFQRQRAVDERMAPHRQADGPGFARGLQNVGGARSAVKVSSSFWLSRGCRPIDGSSST